MFYDDDYDGNDAYDDVRLLSIEDYSNIQSRISLTVDWVLGLIDFAYTLYTMFF